MYPALMQGYQRGSHTIWDCTYHLVWVTKYPYAIWLGTLGNALENFCGRLHSLMR
jgi:REP element-mobilizing transposase RayT